MHLAVLLRLLITGLLGLCMLSPSAVYAQGQLESTLLGGTGTAAIGGGAAGALGAAAGQAGLSSLSGGAAGAAAAQGIDSLSKRCGYGGAACGRSFSRAGYGSKEAVTAKT